MEGVEVGRMVLVDAKEKELAVATKKGVLREQVGAEAGVALAERLVETEVYSPYMRALHQYY